MTAAASVRVWDRVVRATHWCVAALVLWDLYEDSGGPLHRNLGYVAAGLVLVRLAWGAIGSKPARFSSWVPGPSGLATYCKALATGHPPRYLSHSPLGAVMMLALWFLILALAATGWMSRLDAYWGEDWVTRLHGVLAYILMGLVALHVMAAIAMGRLHRENLIAAMLTGNKRQGDPPGTDPPR
ncbi:cytochrome b/b6 domain-containing protein [Cupriavidus sp. 2TAF22]|uniref:cytochrome b/b6 domain-containing protein n=1 Tax=unclassified Cupriavidus TaxID=2640874 RepID=UPI003F909548